MVWLLVAHETPRAYRSWKSALVIWRFDLAARMIVRCCCRLRSGVRPGQGRLSTVILSQARMRKLLIVDQGRPTREATWAMLPKKWKNARIMPFSAFVISRRAVFGFFFLGAYLAPPYRLTIVGIKREIGRSLWLWNTRVSQKNKVAVSRSLSGYCR